MGTPYDDASDRESGDGECTPLVRTCVVATCEVKDGTPAWRPNGGGENAWSSVGKRAQPPEETEFHFHLQVDFYRCIRSDQI